MAYASGVGEFPEPRLKSRICITYYDTGRCPYDGNCSHAHHFSELEMSTQQKLLEVVPPEDIPRHFTGSKSCSNFLNYSFSGFQPFREDSGKNRSGNRKREPLSSSSNKSGPSEGVTTPFTARLPARCYYPHHFINGTYYDVLGVAPNASGEEILANYRLWQAEYRRLRLVDQKRADDMDTVIVEARNVLCHPQLRKAYDRTLPQMPMPGGMWMGDSNAPSVHDRAKRKISQHRPAPVFINTESVSDVLPHVGDVHVGPTWLPLGCPGAACDTWSSFQDTGFTDNVFFPLFPFSSGKDVVSADDLCTYIEEL
ncbi:putative NADH-ubiquinone oxidoreductase complex I subunit [Trypanosoma vivax]|nr:putative NADH-ubiquinone oxidoreductase complex I subunit [Trypanosoma vivax]